MPGDGWQSYDSVAGAYDRVRGPEYARMARDLVELVDPPPDAAVLDLGTGTGVAAVEATRKIDRGAVIGVDPSVPLLRIARDSAATTPVAGQSPGLPFPARTFDVVVANLVLSHFEPHETALADTVRVLRPGGRLGVTVWGSLDDDAVDDAEERDLMSIWESVAARFVALDKVAETTEAARCAEEWFGDPARFRSALEGSGLRDVALHARTYRMDVPQRDVLTGHATSIWGRYLRHALSDADWLHFQEQVAREARAALPDPISRVDQVLIGVGTKPFDVRP